MEDAVPATSPALPPSSPPSFIPSDGPQLDQWPSSPPSSSATAAAAVASAADKEKKDSQEEEDDEVFEHQEEPQRDLLSPNPTRHLAPRTPVSSLRSRPRDVSSEYYTAAWGSPYEFSPTNSDSARTALSQQQLSSSEDPRGSSPAVPFSLEHLIPSRFAGFTFSSLQYPQQEQQQQQGREGQGAQSEQPLFLAPSAQRARVDSYNGNGGEEDNDLTPRSRTKRWVQLPKRAGDDEDNNDNSAEQTTRWWEAEESAHNSSAGGVSDRDRDREQQQQRRNKKQRRRLRPSSVDSVSERRRAPSASSSSGGTQSRGHNSRESNRTLDQQSFWDQLQEHKMASLRASKWADPEPAPAPAPAAAAADEEKDVVDKSQTDAETATVSKEEKEEKQEEKKEPTATAAAAETVVETTGLQNSRWADKPLPQSPSSSSASRPQSKNVKMAAAEESKSQQQSPQTPSRRRWADTPSPSPSPPPSASKVEVEVEVEETNSTTATPNKKEVPSTPSSSKVEEAKSAAATPTRTNQTSTTSAIQASPKANGPTVESPQQPKPSLYASRWAATPPPAQTAAPTQAEGTPAAAAVEESAISKDEATVSAVNGEGEERKEETDLIDLGAEQSKETGDSVVEETSNESVKAEETEKIDLESEPPQAKQNQIEGAVTEAEKARDREEWRHEALSGAKSPHHFVAPSFEERVANASEQTDLRNGAMKPLDIQQATPFMPTVNVADPTVPEPAESKEPVEIKAMPSPTITPVPRSPVKQQRLEPPRLKKKLSWRGKTCIISLPRLDYDALGLVKPLSSGDVQARLKGFEDAGYNVEGFDLPAEVESEWVPSHAKPIYPDEAEFKVSSSQLPPHVRLPDLQRWRDYMDELTEQKLAALGVSIGPEEQPPAPASQTQEISRQSSVQYPPLPFSPPISTASAASVSRPGLTRGHSATMSVASPMSPFGHMHRQSSFAGGPLAFMQNLQQTQSPFQPDQQFLQQQQQQLQQQQTQTQQQQQQQQAMIPGMQSFSPMMQNQFSMPGMERAFSPPQINAFRNIYGAPAAPVSPFGQSVSSQDKYFNGDDVQGQQSFVGMPSVFTSHSNSAQPTPMLPQLPEEDDEDELLEENGPEDEVDSAPPAPKPEQPAYVPPHKRAQLNANISAPTPRGHRHNISEGLERDVLESEHRDKRDRVEIEDETGGDSEATQNSGNNKKTKATPEKDPLGSEITVREAAHSRKKSSARFNVAAPAFSFNPSATFVPASTSFAFTAQPPPAPPKPEIEDAAPAKPAANGQFFFGHGRQKSSGNFNAAAPAFMPSGSFKPPSLAPVTATTDFDFSTKSKPTVAPSMPTSDFDFEAPAPQIKATSSSDEQQQQQSSSGEQKKGIFGRISIPDIIKPTRKSKAIAIVKPDEEPQKSASGTEYEDENGRIAQREDRMKRQRKGGDDGDEVPQFAEPGPIVPEVQMPDPADFVLKSNATPKHSPAASDQVEETVGEETLDANGEEEKEPETAPTRDTAAETAKAKAIGHGHKKSSSLSALAKPFEMPMASSDPSRLAVHAPTESFASISELEEGEIKDRHDGLDAPDSWQHGLTPTPPVLPEFPFENLPPGLPNDPSFDEIDQVMRQLNSAEEGVSGPEQVSSLQSRSITPLPAPVASHGKPMDGVQYLPAWPRSDAPSPSPGRPRVLYDQQLESSLTAQDPSGSEVPGATGGWPPVNRLNKAAEAPTSDWSDMLSPPDEAKLQQRTNFFDSHIESLIGRAIERRLMPLENSLRAIQTSVTKRPASSDQASKQRSSSAIESDADDEDELSEQQRQRPVSRGRDKRIDQIKSVVLEALREQAPTVPALGSEQEQQQPDFSQIKAIVKEAIREQEPPKMPTPPPPLAPAQPEIDLSGLHAVLADMKMSFARAASTNLELDDVRAVVQEALAKQPAPSPSPPAAAAANGKDEPATAAADREAAESTHKRELSELETRFNEQLASALEEANVRRQAEEREAETRRLLRLAEEEVQQLRNSSWNDDERFQNGEKERDELREKLRAAEAAVVQKDEESDDLHARLQKAEIVAKAHEQERTDLLEKVEKAEAATKAGEKERVELYKRFEATGAEIIQMREKHTELSERVERAEQTSKEKEQQHEGLLARLEEAKKQEFETQDRSISIEDDTSKETNDEREELLARLEKAEEESDAREQRIKDLEEEGEATYATLQEYRASSQKWRDRLEEKSREHADLEQTISALERQLDESHEIGGGMRKRLESLHADMAQAAGQLASEKAAWREREDDYRGRCDALEGQKAAYLQERSELHDEIRSLRTSASEAADAKAMMDQMKTSNSSLSEMIRKMQTDLTEQQSLAARFERDFHDARESGRIEVQRTRMAMETDLEAANHQVNIVRAALESELSKVRCELDNVRMEAETAKARHERLIEEADGDRRETLRKVNHTNSVALNEARQNHESTLQETRAAHARALQYAREDKDRSEYILNERLSLADAKMQHYQDRVLHLEERLEVVTSAAQAAAMNAQGRSVPGRPSAAAISSIPEKISPQALRESILVLQEQLQERESRIEKLQNQVDKVAPAKLKAREDEVAWLRELLSVRSDELSGLINTLSRPTFDRDSVRDAAIRIRTTLQMEQQEKDRFAQRSSGDGSPQSLGQAMASLSNFASPRAASLSSAFQKWRENMESSALKNAPRAPGSARRPPMGSAAKNQSYSDTPSKAPTGAATTTATTSATASSKPHGAGGPPGYLSGLMTPPATNFRNTPSPEATGSLPAPRLHPARASDASASSSHKQAGFLSAPAKQTSRSRVPSATSEASVPLFRSQSYDQDAKDGSALMEEIEEDEDLDDVVDEQSPAFRSLEDEMDDGEGPAGGAEEDDELPPVEEDDELPPAEDDEDEDQDEVSGEVEEA